MKKLYWQVKSNLGESLISSDLESVLVVMESKFMSLSEKEARKVKYTLKPVWYSEEEYRKLKF